ncbi:MAG: DUF882 domain-containing protein [Polyangiaceae bacterium]
MSASATPKRLPPGARAALRAGQREPAKSPVQTHVKHERERSVRVAARSSSNESPQKRSASNSKVAERTRKSWSPYVKPAKNKGHLDVSTPGAHFSGSILDANDRLRSSAVRTLNDLLGAGGEHPRLPERLIRLLVEASDTFGGRPIRLVSGYRTSSYYQDSRHKLSSAIDFLIVGVPNAVLCDYLREFEDVGVGYYPNSSFVHLDVRNHAAYWVDYAGPGEAPRSSPNPPSPAPATHRPDPKLLAALEGLLKETKGEIAQARAQGDRDSDAEAPAKLPDNERPQADSERAVE